VQRKGDGADQTTRKTACFSLFSVHINDVRHATCRCTAASAQWMLDPILPDSVRCATLAARNSVQLPVSTGFRMKCSFDRSMAAVLPAGILAHRRISRECTTFPPTPSSAASGSIRDSLVRRPPLPVQCMSDSPDSVKAASWALLESRVNSRHFSAFEVLFKVLENLALGTCFWPPLASHFPADVESLHLVGIIVQGATTTAGRIRTLEARGCLQLSLTDRCQRSEKLVGAASN
jgi:hypothetical protein